MTTAAISLRKVGIHPFRRGSHRVGWMLGITIAVAILFVTLADPARVVADLSSVGQQLRNVVLGAPTR